jgi:hypothetical protein
MKASYAPHSEYRYAMTVERQNDALKESLFISLINQDNEWM